ncbi:hypothetical protein [Blastococcus haudaquaticus]|uniref:Uncharacterized protein n=1 Tax=Blastococcus haudaquaticus TaxID=1938745 RepID=A0A286GNV8_9ACTN|nr:hypothetical protein [Blastococcus haudaquaticus]SOD97241.1 hypothetical protein SAMN06272739_1387 [Blastococcus haudaquaticus]
MRPAGRAAVLLAVLLALLLGAAGPLAAAEEGAGDPSADSVLVVGVPGLTWRDVDPEGTPELWALAGESAIGAVSVRAARGTTCVLDGWATLGAGNRARVPGPDEGLPPVPLPTVPLPDEEAPPATQPPGQDGAPAPEPQLDTSLSYCGLQERAASVALVDPEATAARTAEDEGTRRFGAEPGALASAVGCATVSGRAATLAAAVPDVALTRVDDLPSDPVELAEVLAACRLSLVTLNQLTDAGQPGAEKTDDGTDPAPRAAALLRIDRAVGELRAAVDALPGETLLLLAGISEVNDGRPQLHVGMAAGPGFGDDAWLSSASTGRAPYVQLIDLAPTALRALGLDRPSSMNGQPMRSDGERPELSAAVQELRDLNTAATVHHRNVGAFFWVLVAVSAVVVAAGVVVLGGWQRRPVGAAPGTRTRALLRTLALAAAALPVATYLGGLVPWERTGAPGATLVTAVVVAALAVVALALAGPWRRHPVGPPLVVLAVTLATLLLDVLTGSTLEINGFLGYDAVVAGRFTGYGNLSFGLLSVSALLVTAAVATAVGRRAAPARTRLVTGATVVGIGLLTVAVIGAPALGRDFGGVLSAMPGFLLLAMLLARVRVTVLRFAAILALAVLAVGTVAVLDWSGPADDRSHLGRFVEQVLTGEAWTVVSRKAQANVDILLGSPLAWMLPVALVAGVWLLRPGGLLRGRAGLPPADVAVLRAGLLAGALSLALGAAVNDSGVALPAAAAALLVPLLVWLAAGAGPSGTGSGETAGGAPHSGPVEGAERVTVVSRGSTVGNA